MAGKPKQPKAKGKPPAAANAARKKLPTCGIDPETGEITGRSKQTGEPCRKTAGAGTEHKGQGRCKFHGGAAPIKHGRNSAIDYPRIKEHIEKLKAERQDPLDLLPEVWKVRGIAEFMLENFEALCEAILAWHDSWAGIGGYERLLWELTTAVRASLESGEIMAPVIKALVERLPDRAKIPVKPRRVPDWDSVAGLLVDVGTLVEKIQKQRQAIAVPIDTLNRITTEMYFDLERAAKKVIADESLRAKLVETITGDGYWGGIRMDTARAYRRGEEGEGEQGPAIDMPASSRDQA